VLGKPLDEGSEATPTVGLNSAQNNAVRKTRQRKNALRELPIAAQPVSLPKMWRGNFLANRVVSNKKIFLF
jgi:hypothetical protein